MALTGLDIYKLLPKTNCRECGFPTCLAFALSLAKKSTSLDKCPYVSEEAKQALEASSQPPIKLITIGSSDSKVEVGNETVMFRHEEKFHHPAALGFIIEDSLTDASIKEKLAKIKLLEFERIGQLLKTDLVAIRQKKDKNRFIEAVKLVAENTKCGLVLMSDDQEALRGALNLLKGKKPLIYGVSEGNLTQFANLAKEFGAALSIKGSSLDALASLSNKAKDSGISDIVLEIDLKEPAKKIWEITQIRRQALKKSNRSLGYPVISVVESSDSYKDVINAGDCIAKYSSIVLLNISDSWAVLALLTLRQNIYTDPQKPLQIESKVYSIGNTDNKSPVLVTTNFSLTYYTVLGEVEASKVPVNIISVDTEGMSVLTAWAAEKFTPEKITDSMKKLEIENRVSHRNVIIPGYVAVMSGDLEERSGWKVIVGPKEAAGLPTFLKNL